MKRKIILFIAVLLIFVGILDFFYERHHTDGTVNQSQSNSSQPVTRNDSPSSSEQIKIPNRTQPPSEPIKIEIAPGFLRVHENAGGHLIERHVGKTEADLRQRVNSGAVRTDSTFYSLAIAEKYVAKTITFNQSKIVNYLKGNSYQYLPINYRAPEYVGISFSRNTNSVNAVSGVRVIIAREKTMPDGYRIVTGYPVK